MKTIAFIQGIGPAEIGIIVFLFLLLFGGKRIPALAKGIGQSIRELRNGAKDLDDKDDDE